MSHHETRYCYNMGSNGRICSKLHMYDNSPGMNTPTWRSGVRVIAPPSGDGKSQRIGSYTVRRRRTFSASSAGRPLATRWRPRQAPSCVGCEGPLNAACSFNYYYYYYYYSSSYPKSTAFLGAVTYSKTHETWQIRQKWWKFTYGWGFMTTSTKMAQ